MKYRRSFLSKRWCLISVSIRRNDASLIAVPFLMFEFLLPHELVPIKILNWLFNVHFLDFKIYSHTWLHSARCFSWSSIDIPKNCSSIASVAEPTDPTGEESESLPEPSKRKFHNQSTIDWLLSINDLEIHVVQIL